MNFRDMLVRLNARMLFMGLRSVRGWGLFFAITLYGFLLSPYGTLIPVTHPGALKTSIFVFCASALLLTVLYRRTNILAFDRSLAFLWVFGLFYLFYELGGVDSFYTLVILFPILVEGSGGNTRWLAKVSALTLSLFTIEVAYELGEQGQGLLIPVVFNSIMVLVFVLYFNIIARNAYGYKTQDIDDDAKAISTATIVTTERMGYVERFLRPLSVQFQAMMKSIDEARFTKNTALQGALLGLLYEQIYDADAALQSEGEELLRGIRFTEAVPLAYIVEVAARSVDQIRVAEGVSITVGIDPAIKVRVGVEPAEHMLALLLENAILYSPDGEISIIAHAPANGRVKLDISDNGIGIPDEFMSNIFVRGARAANARELRPGRSGQGLATAQLIASGSECQILVARNEVKRGVCVSVVFPISS